MGKWWQGGVFAVSCLFSAHPSFSKLCPLTVSVPVGLDAAGKTTILYKLKLGEIVTTIPTIGSSHIFSVTSCCYFDVACSTYAHPSGNGSEEQQKMKMTMKKKKKKKKKKGEKRTRK